MLDDRVCSDHIQLMEASALLIPMLLLLQCGWGLCKHGPLDAPTDIACKVHLQTLQARKARPGSAEK